MTNYGTLGLNGIFLFNQYSHDASGSQSRDFLSDKVSRESEQYRGSFFIEVCNG